MHFTMDRHTGKFKLVCYLLKRLQTSLVDYLRFSKFVLLVQKLKYSPSNCMVTRGVMTNMTI